MDDGSVASQPESGSSADDAGDDEADAERRAAAIEEAISRLSKVGELDDAARTTLVATLQRTDQEDWPVVVDAFAESLASAPTPHVVAKADLDTASVSGEASSTAASDEPPPPEPAAETAASVGPRDPPVEPAPREEVPAMATIAPEPPVEPAPAPAQASVPEATPPPAAETPLPPALAIRNASFATRVHAWGVLDRFDADRFRPSQEVIVYFELENLSAGESAAGHTTCIDSRLRLVTDAGASVHEWTFEPIAETCRARRHDYFARYMIRIPSDAKPGRHRVELTVTDTLSGHEAVESVDLEILAP